MLTSPINSVQQKLWYHPEMRKNRRLPSLTTHQWCIFSEIIKHHMTPAFEPASWNQLLQIYRTYQQSNVHGKTTFQRTPHWCCGPRKPSNCDRSVHLYKVRFDILTAVTMKTAVFWDVTPCSFVRIKCYINKTTRRHSPENKYVLSSHTRRLPHSHVGKEPQIWSP
jgi:hypothetical protein